MRCDKPRRRTLYDILRSRTCSPANQDTTQPAHKSWPRRQGFFKDVQVLESTRGIPGAILVLVLSDRESSFYSGVSKRSHFLTRHKQAFVPISAADQLAARLIRLVLDPTAEVRFSAFRCRQKKKIGAGKIAELRHCTAKVSGRGETGREKTADRRRTIGRTLHGDQARERLCYGIRNNSGGCPPTVGMSMQAMQSYVDVLCVCTEYDDGLCKTRRVRGRCLRAEELTM